MSVCLSVCLSVYTTPPQNNGSIHLKLKHIVVYENSSAEFERARKASTKIATLVRLFAENHDKFVARFSNELTHAQK